MNFPIPCYVAFITQLLEMLLSWGLNPNIALGGSRTQHILLSLLELVNLVRNPSDLEYVYELTLTLIQVSLAVLTLTLFFKSYLSFVHFV